MRRFRRCPTVRLTTRHGAVVVAPVATRFGARLLGLAGTDPRPGRGLLIPRCRSVHTFGMRGPLDVLFVARREGRLLVLAVHAPVPPRRVVLGRGSALELVAGEAARLRLEPGSLLRMD